MLLPLRSPRFNAREIIKQLLLLEGHLCDPYKCCVECIFKHLLTIEALADEGMGLGGDSAMFAPLAQWARGAQYAIYQGAPPAILGEDARSVRKTLFEISIAPTIPAWPPTSE